ncbi:hypothetical protein DPMN_135457 [Dreissena polymorpha]|uniref:Uncharacterized protein n=1 Tax=Dreissena polymorpha TaxID=45954 RepID=A0A9D4JEP5_DREPO|nr:hypothetical protein DPMN_135457 [Dreissena polymorpha]
MMFLSPDLTSENNSVMSNPKFADEVKAMKKDMDKQQICGRLPMPSWQVESLFRAIINKPCVNVSSIFNRLY